MARKVKVIGDIQARLGRMSLVIIWVKGQRNAGDGKHRRSGDSRIERNLLTYTYRGGGERRVVKDGGVREKLIGV